MTPTAEGYVAWPEFVGTDDHCGCRIEEIWFDGAELHIHYEDGRADAYLDMDPDSYEPMEFSADAPTVFAGRLAILKWARETTARMTMQ